MLNESYNLWLTVSHQWLEITNGESMIQWQNDNLWFRIVVTYCSISVANEVIRFFKDI